MGILDDEMNLLRRFDGLSTSTSADHFDDFFHLAEHRVFRRQLMPINEGKDVRRRVLWMVLMLVVVVVLMMMMGLMEVILVLVVRGVEGAFFRLLTVRR